MAIDKTIKIKVDTGDSVEKIQGVEKGFEGVENQQKKATTATFGMTGAVKMLGLALKAAGIGLVIGALVGLSNAFMKNQKVADLVNIGLETMNLAFQSLIQPLVNNVQWMIENTDYVNIAIEAFLAIGRTIKNVVMVRILELSSALQAANILWQSTFFGDASEAELTHLKEEFRDTRKEIEDLNAEIKSDAILIGTNYVKAASLQFDMWSNVISDTGKAISELGTDTFNTATQIVNLTNEVKLAEATQRQLQLAYQKDAELQRQIRDDVSLTMEERIAANTKLGEILDEQAEEERSVMLKRLELATINLAQDKDNIDLQVELINAKTELIDLDERIAGQRSEQLVNENSLLKEQTDLEKELAKTKADAAQKKIDDAQKEADARFVASMKMTDLSQKMFDDLAKIRQEGFVKEQNDLDKQLEKGLITQEEYDKETRKLEKASLRAEKRNAKFQILIDTAQGVAAAIKAGSGLIFPANLAAIATGVASVLAGIASAKAVLNQVPGGGGEGGDVSVDATGVGGIGGLIPNMGAIEQPEFGMQPVQAYVVETDISDAQALQEELDIQATL